MHGKICVTVEAFSFQEIRLWSHVRFQMMNE
jgi:hypothetical protein